MGENNLNFFFILLILFLKSPVLASEIECQGAKLRIINKITAEKVFYDIPLSQTLELDNAKIIILRCTKVEKEGGDDEIALVSHKLNSKLDKKWGHLDVLVNNAGINNPTDFNKITDNDA